MKKASPLGVGIFMVASLALGVLFIILFSSGGMFEKKKEYVAFFSGSVKGLSIGAPVYIRGVPVGNVTGIRLLLSETKTESVLIPVVFTLDPKNMVYLDSGVPKDVDAMIERYIKSGMRAKLIPSSLLTGQLAILLDYFPQEPVQYHGELEGMKEIPTVASDMEKIESFIESLDFETLMREATSTLGLINDKLQSPDVDRGIKSFANTFEETEKLVRKLNGSVDPMLATATDTLGQYNRMGKELNAALPLLIESLSQRLDEYGKLGKDLRGPAKDAFVQATATLKEFQDVVRDGKDMNYKITTVIGELEATLRAFRQLAEHLERNPEALLRGNPAQR